MDPVSAMKESEDRLREASCNGDEETVLRILNKSGINMNAQHSINGWTPLHWAAKRNHINIAAYLLKSGADPSIKTEKGETALQLATSSVIRSILGGESNESAVQEELPITPNYIANPPFPYTNTPKEKPMHAESPTNLSIGLGNPRNHILTSAPTTNNFNTGYHMDEDELVLKVRVANAAETDFIEIELDKRRMTFEHLLFVMCKELEVKRELVIKVRKLPDTIVRKDKDVKRLRDFNELELLLSNRAISESSRNYTSSVSPKHIDVVY